MTKVKIRHGHPSRFYYNFSLTDLLKLSEILDFGLCNALQLGITVYNRSRTTILLHKIDSPKSHKVAECRDIRKIPYLCSKTLKLWCLP